MELEPTTSQGKMSFKDKEELVRLFIVTNLGGTKGNLGGKAVSGELPKPVE